MTGKTMNRLLGFLAVSGIAAGLPACRASEHASEVTPAHPITVTVTSVASVDTAERLEAGGVVAAPESATLSSRIVATIAGIKVRAGDRLRAGDIVVTLDARDVSEHVQQARAAAIAADRFLTQARATQSAAEADHQLASVSKARIDTLHAKESATDQERDEADARLASAAARLAGAQAAVEGAEAQLASARAAVNVATATESFTTQRAPFAGVVSEWLVDPGNLAAPGVPLVRIESDGPRQVIVRVDEARATYMHTGDRVNVAVGGPDDLSGNSTIEGIVSEVARAVGADQRAFTVKVTLPGTVTARSGTFARVVFRGAPRRQLLVPARAIQQHGQVSSVYVVENGVAQLRLIHVGSSSPDGVEVLAGLEHGESIVLSPPARLVDGTRVRVSSESTRAGGAS
jgi:RND family efflux transporter MFP subunit